MKAQRGNIMCLDDTDLPRTAPYWPMVYAISIVRLLLLEGQA